MAHDTQSAPPLPPWDLALYTREYTLADETVANQRHGATTDADDAWQLLLLRRPLLYLPDRTPHGDSDYRVDRGPRRRLWRHDELLAFDRHVEQRTRTLLQHQHTVLSHWHNAATRLQAHTRGLLARLRVARMRRQLMEAAEAAARARALAELRARQLRAAVRIQTVYHRHCAHLRYLFVCRQRIQTAVRLFVVRWQRRRAARVIQRAVRAFRRRVALAGALCTLLRLLRLSRQRAELEAAAGAFHAARRATRERQTKLLWQRHPTEMAHATRVQVRKAALERDEAPGLLPSLTPPRSNHKLPGKQVSSHATRLPRLRTLERDGGDERHLPLENTG